MSKTKKYKKKKLGAYPVVSVMFSITLTLFVLGLFGSLLILSNNLTSIIREKVEMQVFLNKNLNENEKTKIIKTLSSKDYIKRKDGKPKIKFITKEEAAKEFSKELGEDFVNFLGDNPLRDVLILSIHPEYQQKLNLSEIKKEIEYIRGVFEVTYIESLVNSINENVNKISYVLIGFTFLFFLIVIVLINNTIKLALFSQRFLIRSMQLVGATSGFIRRPFLVRATFIGLISSLITLGLLWSVFQVVDSQIEKVINMIQQEQFMILASTIIVMGILVGFLSTLMAVKKYLKMSLNELY